jgi:ABC-type transporter Mla subunit MlaD
MKILFFILMKNRKNRIAQELFWTIFAILALLFFIFALGQSGNDEVEYKTDEVLLTGAVNGFNVL